MAEFICMFCGCPVKRVGNGLTTVEGYASGHSCKSSPTGNHILVSDGIHCVLCGDEKNQNSQNFSFKHTGRFCPISPTKEHLLAYYPSQSIEKISEVDKEAFPVTKNKEKHEKREITDKEYKKVEARLEYYERMDNIEKDMIQKYLLVNKDKKIVEQINLKNKQGLLTKVILSVIFILLLYIAYKVFNNMIFILITFAMWTVIFKLTSYKILRLKQKIASSEMPEGKIVYFDKICENVSIWDHKVLNYLSSSKGKEWLKANYY